ncbi:MAG: heavy metal translocating P-type ATPase, partial [Candidatus Cloacimonetes bacterium]|nr:heavy metal translocating P-type ATPase [Candidatus Cloacimonadota bacterium]
MSFEEYEVSNLSCASCSAKIEDEISNMEEVDSVSINLVTQKIQIRYNSEQKNALQRLNQIASSIEPGVKITKARSAPNASLLSWPLIGLGMLLAIFELAIGFPQALYPYPMLLSYLLVGGKVIHSALRKLLKARVFDEHFLMTIATLGALYLGEYTEAIAVMFLYEVGQLLEGRSVDKSRRAIQNLMAQKPELAHLLTGNEIIDKKVSQIRIGDLIQVRPGERIPLDGSIEQGSSELDTSSLTGES